MEDVLKEMATYFCEKERERNPSLASFAEANDERRAMFLAQAEDMLRECPTLLQRLLETPPAS